MNHCSNAISSIIYFSTSSLTYFVWNFDRKIDVEIETYICHFPLLLLTTHNIGFKLGISTRISSDDSFLTGKPIGGIKKRKKKV